MENPLDPQIVLTLSDDEQLRDEVVCLKYSVREAYDCAIAELAGRYAEQIAELSRQFGAQKVIDALCDKHSGARLPAYVVRMLCNEIDWNR